MSPSTGTQQPTHPDPGRSQDGSSKLLSGCDLSCWPSIHPSFLSGGYDRAAADSQPSDFFFDGRGWGDFIDLDPVDPSWFENYNFYIIIIVLGYIYV